MWTRDMSSWSTSSGSDVARKASGWDAAAPLGPRRIGPARRSRPVRPGGERWIPACGTAIPDVTALPAPHTLWVEATDSRGEIAAWWEGPWWGRCTAAWGRAPVRMILLPTPGALLHRAVLARLNRIAVAARRWRLIARTCGESLAGIAAIDHLLRAPYHEVQFCLADGAWSGVGRGRSGLAAQRMLAAMKDLVDLREARGLSRPRVVWFWDAPPSLEDPERLAKARAVARQLRVDRFEVPPW